MQFAFDGFAERGQCAVVGLSLRDAARGTSGTDIINAARVRRQLTQAQSLAASQQKHAVAIDPPKQ